MIFRPLAGRWHKSGLLPAKCCRQASSASDSSLESSREPNSGDAHNTTYSKDPGPDPSSFEKGIHQTFHIRRDGNKPLPLSSFLDPARLAQRHRHKLPKPPPPKYPELSDFRRRMADNPYARLLAEPVRLCHLSTTRLPASFLLSLSPVAHPNPPHQLTLLPLSLYASSLDRRSTTNAQRPQIKARGNLYIISRAPLLQYLVTSPKDVTSYASHILGGKTVTFSPNTPQVIDTLFAGSVLRALSWPLKRNNHHFAVPLPGGPDTLNTVSGAAALLYFGRPLRTPTLVELENNIAASGAAIETGVEKVASWYRSRNPQLKPTWDVLPRANPRVRFPPLTLPMIAYRDDLQTAVVGDGDGDDERWQPPREYSVPVFAMVDVLGEEKARQVVKGTAFEGVEWVVLKEGRASVSVLEQLLKAQWWAAEKGLSISGRDKIGLSSS